ncbi:MAG: electron transfer flavoprotein subunit alpha/FixB family protein [Putridiphycobacter sp.]
MSVLVYIDTLSGSIAKSAFEAVNYASKIGAATVLTNGSISDDELLKVGQYGASNILVDRGLTEDNPNAISKMIQAAAEKIGAETIVFSNNLVSKGVAPMVAAGMKAGLISNAVALPEADGSVKVNVFSGKAFGNVKVNTAKRVIALTPNAIGVEELGGSASIEEFSAEAKDDRIKVKDVIKQEGDVLLTEAETVVSAGRGLKGPENWGMIEDLAKELGAATACSRPVADIGWRPHHEHVGQTGFVVRPNLYIAVGISGAIQHLAGVNGSKVMVVINTDPEAPFFKAADYGVVGDAFEVVPRLLESIKKFKANN